MAERFLVWCAVLRASQFAAIILVYRRQWRTTTISNVQYWMIEVMGKIRSLMVNGGARKTNWMIEGEKIAAALKHTVWVSHTSDAMTVFRYENEREFLTSTWNGGLLWIGNYFRAKVLCAIYVIKLSRSRQRHVVARMHLHKPLNFTIAAKVIAEMVKLFKFFHLFFFTTNWRLAPAQGAQ